MRSADGLALLLACALIGHAGFLAGGPSAVRPCDEARSLAQSSGNTTLVGCGGMPGGHLRGAPRRLFGLPLDANEASLVALTTLPGIGPKRAEAWLATREGRRLERAEDLERIPGVGLVLASRLAPHLSFGPAEPTAVSGARRPR